MTAVIHNMVLMATVSDGCVTCMVYIIDILLVAESVILCLFVNEVCQ